ncbi:MAG: hypothetical protein CV045_02865 [Cyanobacteria bacterium M5B4]|nr:MAG: hypothetical protein CV045_02865 [Cyanobacteria bacterium M5B4]
MQKCLTCGVLKENERFYVYSGARMTENQLYSRVCMYALEKEKPCLNTKGKYDYALGWQIPPDIGFLVDFLSKN